MANIRESLQKKKEELLKMELDRETKRLDAIENAVFSRVAALFTKEVKSDTTSMSVSIYRIRDKNVEISIYPTGGKTEWTDICFEDALVVAKRAERYGLKFRMISDKELKIEVNLMD